MAILDSIKDSVGGIVDTLKDVRGNIADTRVELATDIREQIGLEGPGLMGVGADVGRGEASANATTASLLDRGLYKARSMKNKITGQIMGKDRAPKGKSPETRVEAGKSPRGGSHYKAIPGVTGAMYGDKEGIYDKYDDYPDYTQRAMGR